MRALIACVFVVAVCPATAMAGAEWTVIVQDGPKARTHEGLAVGKILDTDLKSSLLDVICRLSMSKTEPQRKGDESYEQLWLKCRVKGVAVSVNGVSCPTGTVIATGGLNFDDEKPANQWFSVSIFCKNPAPKDR